jgi:hypothetical protein
MSGSKQNCSYDELVRIFQDCGWWEDFRIDPNLEYDVGVDVICVGDLSEGVAPYVTQSFSKNWELYVATLTSGYHPGVAWPPEEGGLFDAEDFKSVNFKTAERQTKRPQQVSALNKLIDHAKSVDHKAPLYGLHPTDPNLIERLIMIRKKL